MSNGRDSIDSRSHNRTYKLRVLSEGMKEMGIPIPDISAYRLWINNSLIMDYRISNKNSEVHRMNTVLIDQKQYKMTSAGYELEIVLEVQDRISYRERPIKLMIGNSSTLANTVNLTLVLNALT